MIDQHLITLAMALQHADEDVPKLQGWGRTTASAYAAGGRLFACGAGASARQAQHLVAELTAATTDRPSLAAVTLDLGLGSHQSSDKSSAPEIAGAPDAIARHDCRPTDVLLCLSASGGEEEVSAAAVAAAEQGLQTWALTGPMPNAVAAACMDAVGVDARLTSTIEEVHLAAIHIFNAAVNSSVLDAIRAGDGPFGETDQHGRPRPAA